VALLVLLVTGLVQHNLTFENAVPPHLVKSLDRGVKHAMPTNTVTVQGTVRPDGSLELSEQVALPPGPVQVTVLSLPDLPKDDPFWQMMEHIWSGQKARGHQSRTEEEIEEEQQLLRDEWEERMRQIESVQAAARQSREQNP
jgi:hypothetical protein